jgi:HEAT repeat protein/KaiC/GvpD/RAD55 family RecA-like ATPase
MSQQTRDKPVTDNTIASDGMGAAMDHAAAYEQHADGVRTASRRTYHFYLYQEEWLWLSLLCLVGLGLAFAVLRVILQLDAAWSLVLSLVCLVSAIIGLWLTYEVRQSKKFTRYQERVVADLKSLRFLSRQIDLDRAFVSLRIAEEFHSPAEQTEREALTRLSQKEARYETAIEIDEAVNHHPALLILGEPGAGKTTLLKHLALRFARDEVNLPLFIPLHEFAGAVHQAQQKGQTLTLLDYLPTALQEAGFNGRRFLLKKLDRGEVVLLLDALDEVPDDASRTRTIQAISQFMRGYGHNRVVIASRIAVYQATQGRLGRFQHAEVLEFTSDQMDQFTRTLLSPQDANRLARIFRGNRGLRNISRNPLLLSVVVTVYETDRSLPERRVDLYERCIYVLLEHWEREKVVSRVDFNRFPVPERLRRLEEIAFYFLQKGSTIEQGELIGQIQRQFDIPSTQDARDFIDEIVRYSGILRQQSVHGFAFRHLSFQEYLSARCLARRLAAPGAAWEQNRSTELVQILAERFSQEELKTLCFNLGIDYDDLPTVGKANKARELVEYLGRRNRIFELLQIGKRLRPDIPWGDTQLSAMDQSAPPGTSGDDVLLPYISQPRWEETLLFLAGIQGDATELIRVIVTHEPDEMRRLHKAARCLVDGDKTQFAVRDRIIRTLISYSLDETDADRRQYAESVLVEITLVREVIDFLRLTLLQETDLTTVARVGWVFTRSGAYEVLQTFTQVLADTNEWIRQWLIIDALQLLNIPDSGEALRQAYPGLATDARARAVAAIAAITADKESTNFLTQQLLTETNTTVLTVIVHSLLNPVSSTAWVKRLEQDADERRIHTTAHIIVDAPIKQADWLEEIFSAATHPALQNSCREALSKSLPNPGADLHQNTDSEITPDETTHKSLESARETSEWSESSLFDAEFWNNQDKFSHLGELGAAIAAFSNSVATDDWVLQVQYLRDVAEFQGEQATQALIEALDHRIAWPVRQIAAGLLVGRGEKAYAAILAARDSPPTHIIDNQNIQTLRKSWAAYGPLLQSGDFYDWKGIMDRALDQMRDSQMANELSGDEDAAQLLSHIQSPVANRLRWQSVTLLGECGYQEAMPDLIQILQGEDSDWELRRRAAVALGQLKNPAATKALQDCLSQEERWDVQVACANALAEIGTSQTLEGLIVALSQAEPQNCADIVAALRRFTVPLDETLSAHALKMVGQVARQESDLDWDMYQVMNTLYQDILTKAGLEEQQP